MSAEYTFTRKLTSRGMWDVLWVDCDDGTKVETCLCTEIEAVIGGTKVQKIECFGANGKVIVDKSLTTEQETAMDGVITTHEAAAPKVA